MNNYVVIVKKEYKGGNITTGFGISEELINAITKNKKTKLEILGSELDRAIRLINAKEKSLGAKHND